MRRLSSLVCLLSSCAALTVSAAEPPLEWVDADTGRRVVRLSREPETASLYFHQNAFTREGDLMVVAAPGGLSTYNWRTREIKLVAPGVKYIVRGSGGVEVGRKTRTLYYEHDSAVFAVQLDTLARRKIGDLPAGTKMSAVNADETLIIGVLTEGDPTGGQGGVAGWTTGGAPVRGPDGRELSFAEQREVLLDRRLELRLPMALFTIDTTNGKLEYVYRATDWLGHVQFSPTDPKLVMYCHEGPWHKVDRLWNVRLDGGAPVKIHARTMNMEIAGHEFFSHDGRMVWYDLQTPRGEDFWLAGYEIATGKRTWYHVERNHWSVHFTISRDGTLFAGDGGDSEMVAKAPDGKWLYLFRPERIADVAGIKNPNSGNLIDPGVLRAERIVNMATHDYRLEPNVHITPDNKWLVFRSNMHGAMHVYAAELAR